MGRDLHYVPGSFYRVDDRTGFPTRAERTRMQWNNLIVDQNVWEPRQPQDLVRGVPDYQAVPYPKPLAPNQFVGPVDVQTSAAAAIGQTVLQVQSIAGFNDGDPLGVMLDNGEVFTTTQDGPAGNGTITLADPLPFTVASGNLLYNYANQPTIGSIQRGTSGG